MGVSKKERKDARKDKVAKQLEQVGWELWLPWNLHKRPPKLAKEDAERVWEHWRQLSRAAQECWAPVQRLLCWAAGTQVGACLVWLVQLLAVALVTCYCSAARMSRDGYAALKARWLAGEAGSPPRKKAEQQAREARRRQELEQRQEELNMLLQLQRQTSVDSSPAAGGSSRVSSSGSSKTRPSKTAQPAGRKQQLAGLRRLSSGASGSERSEEQKQEHGRRRQQQHQGNGAALEASDSESDCTPDLAAAGYAAMLAALQRDAAGTLAPAGVEVASATLPNEVLELGDSGCEFPELGTATVGQPQPVPKRQEQEQQHQNVEAEAEQQQQLGEPVVRAQAPGLESGPSLPPDQNAIAAHRDAGTASRQADNQVRGQDSMLHQEPQPETSPFAEQQQQQGGIVEVLRSNEVSSVRAEQEPVLSKKMDAISAAAAAAKQSKASTSESDGAALDRVAQPGSQRSPGSVIGENGAAATAGDTEHLASIASAAGVPSQQPRRPRHQQHGPQQAALDVWDTCSQLSHGRLRERGQARRKPPAPPLAPGGIPAAAAAAIAAAQRALQPGGSLAAGENSQRQPAPSNALRVTGGKQDSWHQAQQQDQKQQQQQQQVQDYHQRQQTDWQWQQLRRDEGQVAGEGRGRKLRPQPRSSSVSNCLPPVPPSDVQISQGWSGASSPNIDPSEPAAAAAPPGRSPSLVTLDSGKVREGQHDLQGGVEIPAALRLLSGELAELEQRPQEPPSLVQQQGAPPYLRSLSQQQQQSPAGQQHVQLHRQPESNGHRQEVLTAFSGLSNETGEYNCFLNAIVQCLFFCRDFRCEVSAWPPFLRDYNAVLRAVHGVFSALEAVNERAAADASMATGQHSAAGSAHSVVSANALREALSALPGQLFKAGEMNDASEVLITIYDQINKGVAAGLAFSLTLDVDLDALVGLDVREYVHCPACQLTTHATRYTQYIYNTQATGIRDMWRAHGGAGSLGQLLRLIAEETRKSCDPDEGGCNARLPPVHALDPSRAPRIFTLQLAWESQREEAGDIAATLDAVTEVVDLAEVFSGLAPGKHLYRLRSLVCYYGAHYFAYVLLPELQAWAKIDDTHVSRVGSWADVKRKCAAGRVQPSVLFFEALPSSPTRSGAEHQKQDA